MVGLAVGTVEGGQVRFVRGYGETMAGSGNPITPDTVFRWASLSKGIASALVTQLAEDRRLALDAPMASMGTSLTLPGGTTTVTVADLLSHRVGLVRNAGTIGWRAAQTPDSYAPRSIPCPPFAPLRLVMAIRMLPSTPRRRSSRRPRETVTRGSRANGCSRRSV